MLTRFQTISILMIAALPASMIILTAPVLAQVGSPQPSPSIRQIPGATIVPAPADRPDRVRPEVTTDEPEAVAVEMVAGTVRVFRSEAAFENIIVGSDAIAAVPWSEHVVSITAQVPGYSSIVFIDEVANVVSRAEIHVLPAERAGRSVVGVSAHAPRRTGRFVLQYLCNEATGCAAAASNPPPRPDVPETVNIILPGSTLATGDQTAPASAAPGPAAE